MKDINKKKLVADLLAATGWKHRELAAKLEISANTVACWACGLRSPTGPALILMRQWLEEAKKSIPA